MELEIIKKMLDNSLEENHLSHAYIFYGGLNSDKLNMSTYLANKLLNGEASKHPNYYYISGEKNIKKEQITEALKEFGLTPLIEGNRVLVINNSEFMNSYSQNSLLKFLENPSEKTVIILITNNFSSLLQTLKSRSFCINFSSNRANELRQKLLKDYDQKDVYLVMLCTLDYDEGVKLLTDSFFSNLLELISLCVKDPIEALKYQYLNKVLDKSNINYFFNIMIDHYTRYLRNEELYFSKKTYPKKDIKEILMFLVNKKQEFEANLNMPLAIDVLFMKLGDII